MNFLKKIFSDESTAYVGLCKFKTSKVSIACHSNNFKITNVQKNYFATDFSKNLLLL